MGQAEIAHVADEISFADVSAEPWIEAPLFSDTGHGQAAIVMRRVKEACRRERQNLTSHRPVHFTRVALLEIGAATAANEQAVAGEGDAFVIQNISDASSRMPRGGSRLEIAFPELNTVTVPQVAVGPFGAGLCAECDLAAETALEQPCAGHMVRVHMRFQRGPQLAVKLLHQGRVAARLFEDRIDQYRFPRTGVAKEIGISGRMGIEELSKQQHRCILRRALFDKREFYRRIRPSIGFSLRHSIARRTLS